MKAAVALSMRSALLLSCLVLAVHVAARCGGGTSKPTKIVVVLTDDQRWDTLWAMPFVQDRLVTPGVTFENAYVSTPICCPMRASFLSGGYLAQNTGVLINETPNGNLANFDESNSLAVRLQLAGWKTALVGKYMNGYVFQDPPYIPQGWDLFVNSQFGLNEYIEGSSGPAAPGSGVVLPLTQFRTDEYKDQILRFLTDHPNDKVFAVLSTQMPHTPATPVPPGDEALFPGYVYRDRAWQCAQCSQSFIEGKDEFHRNQLRSLQVVDRAVRDIYDHLAGNAQLAKTAFVFTSDNGHQWGEHGSFGKADSWEESLRVPLVIRRAGSPSRTEPALVHVNLDLPATIHSWANLLPVGDGVNLDSLLKNPAATVRSHLFFEWWKGCPWVAINTGTHKGIHDCTGQTRLYDLVADPFEETDIVTDPAQAAVLTNIQQLASSQMALTITYGTRFPPVATEGEPYQIELGTWGGVLPLTWSIYSGALPPGLSLIDGFVSGTPTVPGLYNVFVQVSDSATETYTGEPRQHIQELIMGVLAAPPPGTVVVSLTADQDTTIRSGETQNHGEESTLSAGRRDGHVVRALIRPDVSTIPPGTVIDSAVLRLFRDSFVGGNNVVTTPEIAGGTDQTYVLVVTTKDNEDVPVVSGGGLVWTERKEQCSIDDDTGIRIFTAQGSPSAPFRAQIGDNGMTEHYAVLMRASGVSALVDATGENAEGEDDITCQNGQDSSQAQLTLTSSVDGSLHVVGVTPKDETVLSATPGYTLVASQPGTEPTTYVYTRLLAQADTETFQAQLGDVIKTWATAGIVLEPGPGGLVLEEIVEGTLESAETVVIHTHRIDQDWSEFGAEWDVADGSTPWSGGPGGTFQAVPSDGASIPWGTFDWTEWDVTSIVQDWLDGIPNRGIALISDTALATELQFTSRDATLQPSQLPELRVEYPSPGAD